MPNLDGVRRWLARSLVKSMSLTLVPEWTRRAFLEPSFRRLTEEGFRANAAVFSCISQLVLSYIEPPLTVFRLTGDGGRVALPTHPLSRLLRNPNKQMGQGEILQFSMTYKAIGGNCYWYKVRSAARRVVELIPLNDSQITPIAGGTQLVDHYEFDNGTGKPDIIPAEDMVQFKWQVDPLQPWLGQAPLKAAAREVDSDNEATSYLFSLLKNNAVPPLAIIVPTTIGHNLSEDEKTRMRQEWKDRYGGANRGTPAILEGGVDIKTVGLNLQELAFEALHRIPEARICCVPGTLIITKRGLVAIEDVAIGDEVITHHGRWRMVTRLAANAAYERVVRVEAKGFDALQVTRSHPVYVARYEQTRAHLESCVGLDWMEAEGLRPKKRRGGFDALTMPALRPVEIPTTLRLADWIHGRRFAVSEQNGQLIHPIKWVQPLPTEAPMSVALGRLLGYYLAEGSQGSGKLLFYFASEETQYQQQVVSDLKGIFGVEAQVRQATPPSCKVVVCQNAMLTELFDCGLQPSRIVPPWAWQGGVEFFKGILEGWANGDGNLESGRKQRVTTTSLGLAWHMRLLAITCGYEASIRVVKRSGDGRIRGRKVNSAAYYYVVSWYYNRDREGTYRIENGYLASPVRAVAATDYEGPVYNLEVEDDESYLTTGGMVHNCAAFRVPPVLAGLNVGLEKMTYDNVGGMLKHFVQNTMAPIWRLDEAEMTADLLPEFGGRDDEVVGFDLSQVKALAEDIAAKRLWVDGAVGRGYMTVNEGRSQIGLAKDPNGDLYLRSMATIEVPLGGERPALPAPAGDTAPKGLRQFKSVRDRRTAQRAFIAAQRAVRAETGRQMESAIDAYFAQLAEHIVYRLGKAWHPHIERKDLPAAEDLLTDADRAELVTLVKRYYIQVMQASWEFFNGALGVEVAFDLSDPLVTQILATAGTQVDQIDQTTLQALRDLLQHGSEEGWSIEHLVSGDPANNIPGIRDLIKQTYKGRAETIARTEMGNAQQAAATGRYKDAGVTKVFVLDNGLDDDDEPCKDVNGTVQTIAWAEANPLQHPNCVVGSTQVLARDVLAAYSRQFHGEVIVLRTAANQILTCTPNHPVLTGHGWIAAGRLQQGDYVVCGRGGERMMAFFNPDNQDVPATIQELTDALRKTGGVTTAVVPTAAEDFHGDGADGEVEVIDTRRLLRNAGNATIGEHGSELPFQITDPAPLALAGKGLEAHISLGMLEPANGSMRSGGVGRSLLAGAAGGGHCLSGMDVEDRQPVMIEGSTQRVASDAHLGCQNGGAFAGEIAPVDIGIVPDGGQVQLALGEGSPQLRSAEADSLCNILGAFASETTLVQVVEIERPAAYFGHVYNLSTREGWYLANGIVTHNCTRAFAPEFD